MASLSYLLSIYLLTYQFIESVTQSGSWTLVNVVIFPVMCDICEQEIQLIYVLLQISSTIRAPYSTQCSCLFGVGSFLVEIVNYLNKKIKKNIMVYKPSMTSS